MVRSWLFALLLVAATSPARAGDPADALYRGESIVTGREILSERQRGFREALAQVVVKVTGNARLTGSQALPAELELADRYVTAFSYEDRLAKKKLMDEQGTRERSYRLRVEFDRSQVDGLIARLGGKPWLGVRPKVLVHLRIADTVGAYTLGTDSERGYGQRETFLSAAEKRGIPLVIPTAEQARTLEGTELRRMHGAGALLSGDMRVTEDGYWITDWTFKPDGPPVSWRSGKTTFDRAIVEAVEKAAAVMAGLEEF